MKDQQAQIQEDLRGILEGDVSCDPVTAQLFATDGSIYQIPPLAVVRPKSTADVVACVQYAREHHLPIHARGAGSGLAGESLGTGVVMDFSRHLRRILWYRDGQARVQPGVTLKQLNDFLAARGRRFPPDPANGAVTTMGSVAAINGGGSHSLQFGLAGDFLPGLEVVLADGRRIEAHEEPLSGTGPIEDEGKRALVHQVAELLKQNADLIERRRPKSRFNRSGYNVFDVLEEGHFDLARFFVGSEGTLGLITELTVDTAPEAPSRALAILLFDRLETAAKTALELRVEAPSACDLLDRRLLGLARDQDPRFDLLIPPTAEAALLVEQEGNASETAAERLERTVRRATRHGSRAVEHWIAETPEDVEFLWRIARQVSPMLSRLKGPSRPTPFIEDMAVPPDEMPSFLVKLQNVFKRHQVTYSLFAHAAHGQIHVRPFMDLARPDDVRTLRVLAAEVYHQVFEVQGTISGEHAAGLSRTAFLPQQYGELYAVFREIKRIFDPHNRLNPGKIVGDDPFLTVRNLRDPPPAAGSTLSPGGGESSLAGAPSEAALGAPEPPAPPVIPLQLLWTPAELTETARRCNGCGACRTTSPGARMCPMFRVNPIEEATPRAKPNLLRAVLAGTLPPESILKPEFKEVADLCFNCKMCKTECPAGVDVPRLALEAKAEYVAEHGLRFSDSMLARLDWLSAFGSRFSWLANWALTQPWARWVLEKIVGVARARKLPRFATRPFMRRAARMRLTRPTKRPGPKVLYFVDAFANYYDPELAEAFVSILQHHGVGVYVHPAQQPSGMALVSAGMLDRARQVARHNLSLLAEGVRQGYTIVATEPAAVVCLTQEYPDLLEDSEAQLVASHTVEACHYLWKMHLAQQLRLDFKPIDARVAYHQPCHIRALQIGSPALHLLRMIPKLQVEALDKGCSGMAGVWGLKRENFRTSVRIGYDLMVALREKSLLAGATECSACKMQMEQGTPKPTIHPVKLIAGAYGLLPSVFSLLTRENQQLVVS